LSALRAPRQLGQSATGSLQPQGSRLYRRLGHWCGPTIRFDGIRSAV